MNNFRLLKILSNKKNSKYVDFVNLINTNKDSLVEHNIKVKTKKTNHILLVELYDENNKIRYRTKNPDLGNSFFKLGKKKGGLSGI